MTKRIIEYKLKWKDLLEDAGEYSPNYRYIDLDNKDFCCQKMLNALSCDCGQNHSETQLNYNPNFREYSIDSVFSSGGFVMLIEYCPWCGKKLPLGLRDKFFDILKKEYKIETNIDYKEDNNVPEEFKSDQWWKKRGL